MIENSFRFGVVSNPNKNFIIEIQVGRSLFNFSLVDRNNGSHHVPCPALAGIVADQVSIMAGRTVGWKMLPKKSEFVPVTLGKRHSPNGLVHHQLRRDPQFGLERFVAQLLYENYSIFIKKIYCYLNVIILPS